MKHIYVYTFTKEEKQIIANELKRFCDFCYQTLGYKIYLVYGTLLGAMREKSFILHDYDIDIAYQSKYRTLKEIKEEYDNRGD
jgi:phosphorylcholine metabolism protein LicD